MTVIANEVRQSRFIGVYMGIASDAYRLSGGALMRRGYTTGSCAAAAAKAAAAILLTGELCGQVELKTPNGAALTLDILDAQINGGLASCAVRKDSGDDPDVTNGVLVYARVTLRLTGVEITGGEGVGQVTKPGLDQPVGAYAINSAPRRMIEEACREVCVKYGYGGGFSVTISVPGGEELAKKTFNPRLGIVGGISILGTTGIVEPMSDDAMAGTIRAELSLLYAAGRRDALLTVGNYSEAFAADKLRLSLESNVKCSNFIGETLSAAVEIGFTRALLIGHLGKLVKLGAGITNTHSKYGDARIDTLISCALEAGAALRVLRKIKDCVSTDAALECLTGGLAGKTAAVLRGRAEDTLIRHTGGRIEIGVICFSGAGENAAICFQNEAAGQLLDAFSL